MLDKNGVEIRTGDVVRISNAYFKNDNGLYFVEHSPDDISWCGRDHALEKIKRNGQLSTAKYRTAFWPLWSCTNNHTKNAMADDWNLEKRNAEIEVVTGVNRSYIAEFFQTESDGHEAQRKYYAYRWGEDHAEVKKMEAVRDFYQTIVDRIKAEDATQASA